MEKLINAENARKIADEAFVEMANAKRALAKYYVSEVIMPEIAAAAEEGLYQLNLKDIRDDRFWNVCPYISTLLGELKYKVVRNAEKLIIIW